LFVCGPIVLLTSYDVEYWGRAFDSWFL